MIGNSPDKREAKKNAKTTGVGSILQVDSHSDDESSSNCDKRKFRSVCLSELMRRRNSASEMEIDERRYSALRIGEYLETNFIKYPRNNKDNPADQEDEFGLKKMFVHNILDPPINFKVIERESIG
jgi:hypothetical protein